MAKKLTFDKLPAAVEKILEILNSEEGEHAALPELLRRVNLIEKKIDDLHRTLAPERPVMDMPAVCKVLKLRPKAVNELALSGVLPSREQGRKTVFYEDGVVRYFMTRPTWETAAAEKEPSKKTEVTEPAFDEAETAFVDDGERRRVSVPEAAKLLDRSLGAMYQLTSTNKIPFQKEGTKVYFFTDELRQWALSHPARKRRGRKE